MSFSDILFWLNTAPQLNGETVNWDYLPSWSGWSLTVPKSETGTDILGNVRTVWQLKITRRCSVQSNEERLALAATLEDLAAWAVQNPPILENGLSDERPQAPCVRASVRRTALSELQFTNRNGSGVEDVSVMLILSE